MSTFGQRLKEERKRLGLTQPEFAAVGGVEKGAQINYEQDKRFPSTEYLIAVSELGVDARYVLLGKPSSDDLADDEKELLIGYRSLDERAKARVLGVIEGAMPMDAARTMVTVSGNVGQQIHGDVHGTVQGPDMRKQVTKKK